MNNLPVEVLNQIFLSLHQHDKLECMTVCRQWANIITSFILYHTVRIGSMVYLKKLIETVKKDPEQGCKIERLVLDADLDADFRMDTLPFLFPNIKDYRFYNIYEKYDYYHMPFTNKLSPHHPWSRQIEHITEYSTDLHTGYILQSGLCPHLKTIVISGTNYDIGSKFIALLKNAPVLSSLTMIEFDLKLEDFEFLHEAAPLLQSLTLDDGEINCSHLPSDMKPPAARLIKLEFKMTRVSDFPAYLTLFEYIKIKYTHLTQLAYDVLYKARAYEWEEYYNKQLARIIGSLNSPLKDLGLYFDLIREQPFSALDKGGCQVQNITLRDNMSSTPTSLVSSNLAKSIKSLKMVYMIDTSSLTSFSNFKSLTVLHLRFSPQALMPRQHALNLHELLAATGPQLETLRIRHDALALNTTTPTKYKLKHLWFDMALLSNGIDSFISQALPNLQTLKFTRCKFESRRSLILSNLDLNLFEMVEQFSHSNPYLMVTTLDNNEERWYTAMPTYSWEKLDSSDRNLFPAVTSIPFDKTNGAPSFTLVCQSLKKLYLVNSLY